MSRFTGKCDFYDDIYMIYEGDVSKFTAPTTEIYVGNAKIDNSCEANLAPYLTNVQSSGSYSAENWHIHLMSDSWIDVEERQSLSWRIRDAIIYMNKNKEAVAKDVIAAVSPSCPEPLEIYEQIVEAIKKDQLWKFNKLCKDNDLRFIENYLIPEYFYGIHLPRYQQARMDFLEFVKSKGADEFHPIILKMKMALISH